MSDRDRLIDCPTCGRAHPAPAGAEEHYCSIACYRFGHGLDDPATGDGRRWCAGCQRYIEAEWPWRPAVLALDVSSRSTGVARRPGVLDIIDELIAAHMVETLDQMVEGRWPVAEAVEAYRAWWRARVDAAVDEGLAEWTWRGPA